MSVPEFRDATREYLEIAVIQLKTAGDSKANRLIELVHRAIPYPVVLIVIGESLGLSTAHKRQALNEPGKTVIDGDVVTIDLATAPEHIQQSLLEALPLAIQPRNTFYVLYQAWLDVMLAFQAALVTGRFKIFDSTSQVRGTPRGIARRPGSYKTRSTICVPLARVADGETGRT